MDERQNYRAPRQSLARTALSPVVMWLAITFCIGTAGCSTSLPQWARNKFKVGPNYERPPAPVAPAWIDSDNQKLTCDPVNDCLWWTVFNDPTLNGLIETAYRQNLDLRVAGTRILEARAQRNIAVGNLFPQQQTALGAYGARSDHRKPGALRCPAHSMCGRPVLTLPGNWTSGAAIAETWKPRMPNGRRSSSGTAIRWSCCFQRLPTAYVQLRTFEERLRFARHNVEIQQGSLGLAESRFTEGVSTELDVRQARTSLCANASGHSAAWKPGGDRPAIACAFCWGCRSTN